MIGDPRFSYLGTLDPNGSRTKVTSFFKQKISALPAQKDPIFNHQLHSLNKDAAVDFVLPSHIQKDIGF